MLKINELQIENLREDCVTDNKSPSISFALDSDLADSKLEKAVIMVNGENRIVTKQVGIVCENVVNKRFTSYEVSVTAQDNHNQSATRSISFTSGRLDLPWEGNWITDRSYRFANGTSPVPMTFMKSFTISKKIRKAFITSTAIGIYELNLNGSKVGDEFFAPGFTSYKHTLQYQYYDVTNLLLEKNELQAVVGPGWAVGRFTYHSKSKITEKRQALLLELFLEYEDGTNDKIVTDDSWKVTVEGNYRFGDFYDGETYDATIELASVNWKSADTFHPRIKPIIVARYGCKVTAHELMLPKEVLTAKNGGTIYDFGQNFAGVIKIKLQGKKGQTIRVRHSETIFDGDICVNSLRTAKATATYICMDGEQEYMPRLTYMGFRYVEVFGIKPEQIEVMAVALYSDFDQIGEFSCSNSLLNKLQSNIVWSGKSNFVDIPTDCPQRDERLGWTGDIAIFSSTACFNFDMGRFLDKWLVDVRAEQSFGGGIPMVVPSTPGIGPVVATACWGDSCIIVPWVQYMASGDVSILRKQYSTMKRFLKAAKFWAGLGSVTKDKRRVWKLLFQFGDWCAPGNGTDVKGWLKKGPWMGTAYFANSTRIVSEVAEILGEIEDSKKFKKLHNEICRAFINVFTDGNGKLHEEFQTGYVLPIYFGMADNHTLRKMSDRLNKLVVENDYHLATGFPGTPFLLFALSDYGHMDTAFKLLLQDTCPSWIYQIKRGGTTLWEQWDNIKSEQEETHCISDSSVSFNHYAYGAVGDFMYRRILGIEATEAGYRKFKVQPILGGNLTSAKGSVKTPYGRICVSWKMEADEFSLWVEVPVSTMCEIILPNGRNKVVRSGRHYFK